MTRLGTTFAAAVLLTAGSLWMAQGPGAQPGASLIGAAHAQAAETDTSTIVEMVQGAADAPVEIIEYSSFTCPHCANFHAGPYHRLKEEYIDTGKVKLVYREVYFDRYGLWASMIARCDGPEKFFGMTEMIFETQSEWVSAGGPAEIADELRKIGRLAGIADDQIEACLQNGNHAQTLVAWYQENAGRDGISSTPSFVINGKTIKNRPYEDIKALIDAELGS